MRFELLLIFICCFSYSCDKKENEVGYENPVSDVDIAFEKASEQQDAAINEIPDSPFNEEVFTEEILVDFETNELILYDYQIIRSDDKKMLQLLKKFLPDRLGYNISEAVISYTDENDDYYSRYAQKWESLYLEWVKGNSIIFRIIVDGDGYESSRGIKVGDTVSDINNAYGENIGYRSDSEIEFDLGNPDQDTTMALIFYLKNNVVERIELMHGD